MTVTMAVHAHCTGYFKDTILILLCVPVTMAIHAHYTVHVHVHVHIYSYYPGLDLLQLDWLFYMHELEL